MDDFSYTSKSLKPIAPPQVVFVPEQCEEVARKEGFEERKRSVLKSVFLVFSATCLLVAALYFGLWIIQTRIQSLTQGIKGLNDNQISSHEQTEERSFLQKPWLSNIPSNYIHVSDEIEDTDTPLKTDDDNMEGKEQIKEDVSSDSKINYQEVEIDVYTSLLRNPDEVEKLIQDRLERLMNTTTSEKRIEVIDTKTLKKEVVNSNIQPQDVQEAEEDNHQHLLAEPTRNTTRTSLQPIPRSTTPTTTKPSQYKPNRIVYIYPWRVDTKKISETTTKVPTSTTDPLTTSMAHEQYTTSATTKTTRTPAITTKVPISTTTSTSSTTSRIKTVYQFTDLFKYNLHKVAPPLEQTNMTSGNCEWLIPTEYDNYFECQDGSFCEGFSHNLSCCNSHGGRAKCPRNRPVMCADKRCAGGNDYCCSVSTQQCYADANGPRYCGPTLVTSENCKTGLTVGRGRDWIWDNQDHINGNKVTGTITLCDRKKRRIAKVQWDGGRANIQRAYRIGVDGAFDLAIKAKFRNNCDQCSCGIGRIATGRNMSLYECKSNCEDDENCKGIEHWNGSTLTCYQCRRPHRTFTSTNYFENLTSSVYVKVPRNAVTSENCHKGQEVQRGRDWFYGTQDHAWRLETSLHPESFYHPHYGTIQNCKNNEWADVGWDNVNNSYPIGAEGMYALSIRKGPLTLGEKVRIGVGGIMAMSYVGTLAAILMG